jgi:hypothetical protein
MKKVLFILSVMTILLSSQGANAGSDAAKAALGQSTTNSFCSAGFNGNSPFEKSEMFKKDQFQSGCPAGMSYVECLRQSWKNQK